MLSDDISERLHNRTFTYDDIKLVIENIKMSSYFYFYDFVHEYMIVPHIVEISLPAWYIQITKKCNNCDKPITITDKNSDTKYYTCYKCDKTYTFNKYEIDDYVITKFSELIKRN